MTYQTPELQFIGAARGLVLGDGLLKRQQDNLCGQILFASRGQYPC